jgi:hypothetical protein
MWQKNWWRKRVENRETISTSRNGVDARIKTRRNRLDRIGETLVVSSGFPWDPLLRRRGTASSRAKAQLPHGHTRLPYCSVADASSCGKHSAGTRPSNCSVTTAPYPRVQSAPSTCGCLFAPSPPCRLLARRSAAPARARLPAHVCAPVMLEAPVLPPLH